MKLCISESTHILSPKDSTNQGSRLWQCSIDSGDYVNVNTYTYTSMFFKHFNEVKKTFLSYCLLSGRERQKNNNTETPLKEKLPRSRRQSLLGEN